MKDKDINSLEHTTDAPPETAKDTATIQMANITENTAISGAGGG